VNDWCARCSGSTIREETVASIVEQSEGNALFLEELIRNVAEGHADEAPATVLAMLQARIGRLELHVRKILRCASIFGESSWSGGIRALFGTTIHSVSFEDALRSLVRAEILELRRESRFPGEQEYRFRHGLMRDAAYGLLADEERVAGHRLAAEYLETVHEQDSLIVAEHYVQGQEPSRAVAHLLRAATQSCDNGDMNAALHVAERALVLEPDPASRGALLAVKTRVCVWREQYIEVLKCGHEALALVEVGGYRWCQLVQQMMPAAAFTGQIEVIFQTRDAFADKRIRRSKLALLTSMRLRGYRLLRGSWANATFANCFSVGRKKWWLIARRMKSSRLDICFVLRRITITSFKNFPGREHVPIVMHALRCPDLRASSREECLANVFHGKALMDLGAIEEAETLLREKSCLGQTNQRTYVAWRIPSGAFGAPALRGTVPPEATRRSCAIGRACSLRRTTNRSLGLVMAFWRKWPSVAKTLPWPKRKHAKPLLRCADSQRIRGISWLFWRPFCSRSKGPKRHWR
jgi:hypothetical protein